MQIDTKNRHYNGTDFKPDILPKASAAPPNASYSGILECPCTDRINKTIDVTYQALNTGKCEKIVTHPTDCFNAAKKIDPSSSNAKQITLDSKMYPSGCSLLHYGNGTTNVIYNTNSDGAECGGNSNKWFGYLNSSSTKVAFSIDFDSVVDVNGQAIITLTGPDGVWFGVGLGTKTLTMYDKPYAIIVDGNGAVTERKLGNHAEGIILEKSVQVVSSRVLNGIRNVIMTRAYKGKSPDHYTFDPEQTSVIPHITASGTGPSFSYHGRKTRGGANLQIYTLDSPTCLCNAGVKGSINGIPFSKNCLEEPQSDLLQQKNPTCWVDTYQVNMKQFFL